MHKTPSPSRSEFTPNQGIKKNPAARVPTILPRVPILPIFHKTSPPEAREVIFIFIAIGEIIPKQKLMTEKRQIAEIIELILTSDMYELKNISSISFPKNKRKNHSAQ
jgi:hypothetical protein